MFLRINLHVMTPEPISAESVSKAYPTLGAAIIVKNAEHTLGNTLRSLRGVVDQVVVVDTGSGDESARIAIRAGAEVYFHSWTDDFSAARNLALGYMRTDRVLVIDADEYLDAASRAEITSLPLDETVGGYRVRIVSGLSETTDESVEHRYPRIFRRRHDIRFRGVIHEQISDSIIDAGLQIRDTNIVVHHDGYRRVDQAKLDRNIKLLNAQQENEPNDVWTAYHRGMTAFSAGDHTSTMNIMQPLLSSPLLATDQREFAMLRYAQSALAMNQQEKVFKVLELPMSDMQREGLRRFVIGAAHTSNHDFAKAIHFFELATETSSTLIDRTMISRYIQSLRSATN